MKKFYPWQELFELCFNKLNILPHIMWQITPQELVLFARSQNETVSAITKQELEKLIKKYG
jgi:hypothetical protein